VSNAPRRLPAFDYVGRHRYFLTICIKNREPAFLDARLAVMASTELLQSAAKRLFTVSAFCVMPGHVHVLLEGAALTSDLRELMHEWKHRTGYQLARNGRVWQRGYHDRVLRNDEDSLTVAAYILCNPIRAGLVKSIREYPFVGSSVYSIDVLEQAIQERADWRRGD
jgi:putative transposase